jgi:Flp pilus assembly protein TadG
MKRLAHKLANTRGAEIAEVAMVLPLVFTLLMGIIWFGRAFNIYSTIQQAAQQGAITAARNSCASCSNTAAPDGIVTSCPEAGPAGSVANAVAAVMCASSIDPTQIPVNTKAPTPVSCVNPSTPLTCTSPGNITICRQALLNSSTQSPQCGVIVSFQYPYQFYLPFTSVNMQLINLSAQAQSRMEN